MCATCGCAGTGVGLAEPHQHGHDHPHDHDHWAAGTETVLIEQQLLAKNDALAGRNRDWLRTRGVAAVNLMSSPGSGKTTLLERTIRESDLGSVCVIEGDQETSFDADRIKAAGAPVLQINTGAGCHLDAEMVGSALRTLDPDRGLVLIENVGNLVCPALFDLGEAARVVIMSVTEGTDKPRKYPHIFSSASLVVLNKIDLLPYVDFEVERFSRDVRLLNPAAELVQLSATRGDGLKGWYDWLGELPGR